MASSSADSEELGSPALTAAAVTFEVKVDRSEALMMASSTAEPNAPPIALAENASPVAVERYS